MGQLLCGWGRGRWKMTNMFSSAIMSSILVLAFTTMVVEGKELERFSRKGKVVTEEADGNIAIELRRKRSVVASWPSGSVPRSHAPRPTPPGARRRPLAAPGAPKSAPSASPAKIESAAEQTAAFALTGGVNTWIGLNDIGTEGTFTWADDSALGSYTNWNTGEPDSTAAAPAVQHCINLRAADGFWNDVLCGSA